MGRPIRAVLEGNVSPGMHVADVGANQGICTLLLSRLVGPSGRVTALEPDPVMAEALRNNLQLNGSANVTLIEAGADARSGDATLFHSRMNGGDKRLARGELSDSCTRSAVRVVRLDDVIPDRRLDFIKIDTQGWEMNVLEGMSGCLRDNPRLRILFEFWPHGLRQAGRQPADLLALLFDFGFDVRTMGGTRVTASIGAELAARLGSRGYTDLFAERP